MVKMTNFNNDINEILKMNLPWDRLKDKTILITGGTGLIGSIVVNVLARLACKIYVVCRNAKRANEMFDDEHIYIIPHDINEPLQINEHFDFILHLASNTHPVKYASEPIETILTNIIGLRNVLDLADENTRVLFTSSCEIYGENRNDVNMFDENYCGYINCNTLRAGYTESKRCGEALCQAYIKQKNLDIVIARLARIYGPSVLKDDSKVINQFLKNAKDREDIVLKSKGEQEYSFLYVSDAVSAIFTILLLGNTSEAYNVSDEKSNTKLKELARTIAELAGTKVKFDLPSDTEKQGFSPVTKALLNNEKLKKLNWYAKYDIQKGIEKTFNSL
jgi:nucleoside-diphosphate-sugar epimerase